MRQRKLVLGFILSLFTTAVLAHGGGHSNKPVDQSTAKTNATQIVAALVKREKLDKSWAKVKASSVVKKTVEGEKEWEVIFVNGKISDTKKQTFYVYLTLGGDYLGADHKGQ